ncbi:hypothetical protein [uncultured Bacteroides sp.]|uniref:hypothetical protein n=1 Tax=uncultured Bacteroides sp. TaxID=162156 RepID=UPI002620B508|nr:hypothetical protein [uncultured Bacteroides sp.]
MYKQSFGTEQQVQFANEHEFYSLLGYLAKSDGTTSIVWEHNENQEAWGSGGRIQIHTPNMPNIWNLRYTAGNRGNVLQRVNCNEFIENICKDHGFVDGRKQDKASIRKLVPAQSQADFDRGYAM